MVRLVFITLGHGRRITGTDNDLHLSVTISIFVISNSHSLCR